MKLRKGVAHATLLALTACAQAASEEPTDVAQTPATGSVNQAFTASEETFSAFESGQVRPLALSANGKYLYAVNTPDNRLEIFATGSSTLTPVSSVRVGLEPVSVAVAPNGDVWVVNHLSDSISIISVASPSAPYVKRTLLVGDEPRDIVFAGGSTKRAFITTAHRGQNTGRDPQLTTPGVGRADVWVFDATAQGSTLEGTPVTVITLFSDTPRALAVSGDGKTVYAAAFHSGNRTTAIPERIVTNNGGLLGPNTDANGVVAPWAGLIAKYRIGPDGQYHWLDDQNRNWDVGVNFSLPDKDVFAIDANATTPVLKTGSASQVPGVGTVLFNMAVNPVNGKVYVSNLESRNDVRFEGHNEAGDGTSVRGHIAESRITVISGGTATPRHLNTHINYAVDGTPAENAKSLAFPTGMQVSANGSTLYVAALGSSKLGVFKTSELEAGTFVPSTSNQVTLSGGGPTGLALHESAGLAYVMTRFDNGISVVKTSSKKEVGHLKMYNPEPASITAGRRFLYDAAYTSSHGDSACASCHVFGDFDSLSWDLGDPDGTVVNNPGPFFMPLFPFFPSKDFHPLKGPMATQSLRGMANHGPMHWRGDRTGGNDAPTAHPDSGAFDEDAAFKKFNPAFVGLLGRSEQLTATEMQQFTDFMLQVMYPPNPIRALDNSLTADQQAARAFYFNSLPDGTEAPSDTFRNCNGCHTLDPEGNAEHGVLKPGFFGTSGGYAFEAEPQFMKIPHLRNAYQKVGMFGMGTTFGLPIDSFVPSATNLPFPFNDDSFQGDQVRGFGFLHDGSVDTVYRFLGNTGFAQRDLSNQFPNPFGIPVDATGIQLRRQLESLMLAFDSNLAPIVGQQATLTKTNATAVDPRIALLKARAAAGECDLIVTGFAGREIGFLYLPDTQTYQIDIAGVAPISETKLRKLTQVAPLTFMAVPPGSGERIALDRDCDAELDSESSSASLSLAL